MTDAGDRRNAAGTLLIVSAPSGAGKTTLVRGLLERDRELGLSVSFTTRAPRSGERHGVDYHFVGDGEFLERRDRGEFVEWAVVHGNYYGSSSTWLHDQTAAGRDIVLEIDWQGARQVRRCFPSAVGVFVLPPSVDELERRLRGRGTDSDAVIGQRLLAARSEMRHLAEFDYVIINNELSVALDDLQAVLRASRLRYARQKQRHPEYLESLEQD
ncbi:MAG: guanylate kinase [Rhodocyclaceae bacterium]|nr:guanylate kinase [Rhodocyclaceae bacterium]